MELTYNQWLDATLKEKAEYLKWIVSQIEFDDETGRPTNIECYSESEKRYITHSFLSFDVGNYYYRIKPAPKYRPFQSIEEFAPHADKWVVMRNKNDLREYICKVIKIIDKDKIQMSKSKHFTLQEAFIELKFIDLATGKRSPCGVKE